MLFRSDCITHFPGWAICLSQDINCDLVNLAEAGSSNGLQIQLMQEFLIDNNITNDIVIWQISHMYGPVRINMDHYKLAERMNRLLSKLNLNHYITKFRNKFDNEYRIDLLHVSPMRKKFGNNIPLDIEQELQNLLFMFIIIKKICPKILVFRGRNDCISEKNWNTMKKFFSDKNIEYLDEILIDWVSEHNLPFTGEKPRGISYKEFNDKIISPKLKKLEWF